MTKPFIHLHNHSEFSPLDGLSRVEQMAKRAAELEMPAIALTDHGFVAGAPEFYAACRKEGVEPILGQEFYIVPDSSKKDSKADDYEANKHIILLALNVEGWHSIVELTSLAHEEKNFYYKPRLDHDILREYQGAFDNIAVTSACLSGEIAKALQNDSASAANKMLKFYKKTFPNFYLELQRHPIRKKYRKGSGRSVQEREFITLQNNLNSYLLRASKKFDVPYIISNDSHYIDSKDHKIHDFLLAMQTGADYYEENRFRFNGYGYDIKSTDDMKKAWLDKPQVFKQATKNARVIAGQAAGIIIPEFESTTWHVPAIPGQKGSPPKVVKKRCIKRLKELGLYSDKRYRRRLSHELSVIREANFEQIFLIVDDYVNWARDQGIIVGLGRGSMVGVLVSYLLGITEIDPVRYNLLFERAINPARPSIPDFDIDFDSVRIEEVVEYVKEKYGAENVVRSGTMQHMAPKMTVKRILKTLGVSFQLANNITSELPDTVEITNNKVEDNMQDILEQFGSDDLKQIAKDHPIFTRAVLELHGLLVSYGSHAAGVIISDSDRPLLKEVPRMRIASSNSVVSQFDMEGLQKLHLIKFDFLGLKTLRMIDQAIKMIGHNPFDGMKDWEDTETYEMMSRGDTVTTFQYQGPTATRCIMEMGVSEFEDIVAVTALARPGAINFLPDYIKGKENPKSIKYACPEVKPILYTNGVIIYQEQVMEIVKTLAGWDDLGADRIKEAIKHKSGSEFDEMGPEFIKGCRANGIKRKAAERVWAQIDDYRSYGFNRAHSVAYSAIGFQTAYLKCHYPREWFTAVLNTNANNKYFEEIISEIRRLEVPLLLPDINRSSLGFTLSSKGIRFGLAQIKGMGVKSVQVVLQERSANGRFKNMEDFARRMDPVKGFNKARLAALGSAGAFSRLKGGMKAPATMQVELLGTQVTDYELDNYKESIGELIEETKNWASLHSKYKEDVFWGGIVTKVNEIKTRKGDLMAFLGVSYYGRSFDITMFPDKWKRFGPKLKKNRIVAIYGERDPERNTIVCNNVRVLNINAA